jgi:hypothetical protein
LLGRRRSGRKRKQKRRGASGFDPQSPLAGPVAGLAPVAASPSRREAVASHRAASRFEGARLQCRAPLDDGVIEQFEHQAKGRQFLFLLCARRGRERERVPDFNVVQQVGRWRGVRARRSSSRHAEGGRVRQSRNAERDRHDRPRSNATMSREPACYIP